MGDLAPQSIPVSGNHALLGTAAQLARGPRTRRALSALVAGVALWDTGKPAVEKLRTRLKNRSMYTIAVTSEDEMWAEVHRWLLARLPDEDRHALVANSGRARGVTTGVLLSATSGYDSISPEAAEPDESSARRPVLEVRYDGSREQVIDVGGHLVNVKLERPDGQGKQSDEEFIRYMRREERIIFTARSREGRDAVLAFLRGIVEASWTPDSPPQPSFYMGRWGGWERIRDLPARPLSTVILKAGQIERIVNDLARFLALEADYARAGAPWHRGYLFHGPPGTGKTSLAKALAQHFDLDVYYLPLSDLSSDTNLHSFLGQIKPRSMLVLEDIDVVHAARERDDDRDDDTAERRISASGLLNALDGLGTPNGLITVMTTNDPSVLDPALIRPGRADLQEELGYLDDEQLDRLVAVICGPGSWSPRDLIGDRKITHAEVVSAAVPFLDDGWHAHQAIRSIVGPYDREMALR